MVEPLLWIHGGLSKLAPELAIDLEEAQTLSRRMVAYARHTSVNVDPKTKDLIALIFILMVMYSGRVGRINARRAAERKARAVNDTLRRDAAGNVINIDGTGIRGV